MHKKHNSPKSSMWIYSRKSFLLAVVLLLYFFPASLPAQTPRGQQSVYLHSDRDIYVAGEALAFSVYSLNLDNIRKTNDIWVTTGLFNASGEILIRKTIEMPSGFGQSYYLLPDTLSTGLYYIVATSSMEPSPEYVFRKPVYVFNRFDSASDLERRFLGVPPGSQLRVLSHRCIDPAEGKRSMVVRLSSDFAGFLNDTIDVYQHMSDTLYKHTFITDFNGIGHFQYQATSDLEQIVMQVRACGSQVPVSLDHWAQTCVGVSRSEPPLGTMDRNQGYTYYVGKLGTNVLESPIAQPSDLMKGMPPGIYSQWISGPGQMRTEPSYFFYESEPAFAAQKMVPESRIAPRSIISMDTLWGEAQNVLQYSMSIVPEQSLLQVTDMAFYSLFLNELYKNGIRIPADILPQYILPENASAYLQWFQELGSKQEFGNDPTKSTLRQAAPGRFVLDGFLIDSQSRLPVAGQTIRLNALDTLLSFDLATTDDRGFFAFYLNDYWFEKTLVLHPAREQENWQIMLNDRLEIPVDLPKVGFHAMRERLQYISTINRAFQIHREYGLEFGQGTPAHEFSFHSPARLFSQPSWVFRLADFAPMDNFEEISREILHPLRLRQSSGGAVTMSLVCNTENRWLTDPPAVFVNGIEIRDLSVLLDLNSEQISRVELQNLRWFFGEESFPGGIVSVFTQMPEVPALPVASVIHRIRMERNGVWESRTPQQSRHPDFRQLLLWQAAERNSSDEPLPFQGWFGSSDTGESFHLIVMGRRADGTFFNFGQTLEMIPTAKTMD
ncbi:MAG: hypothetical protein ACK4VN_07545 [Bacteroidales bacterium]